MEYNRVMKNIVHLYAGSGPHEDSVIVGDREGLTNLRNAIDEALGRGKPAGLSSTTIFVNDGEGFDCFIVCDNMDRLIKDLATPYTGESSIDHDEKKISGEAAVIRFREQSILR